MGFGFVGFSFDASLESKPRSANQELAIAAQWQRQHVHGSCLVALLVSITALVGRCPSRAPSVEIS